jgi:hypothetical protein
MKLGPCLCNSTDFKSHHNFTWNSTRGEIPESLQNDMNIENPLIFWWFSPDLVHPEQYYLYYSFSACLWLLHRGTDVTSWAEPFPGKWWLRGCLCCWAVMVTTDSKVEFQCPKLEFGDYGLRGGLALEAIQQLSNLYYWLVRPLGGKLMV